MGHDVRCRIAVRRGVAKLLTLLRLLAPLVACILLLSETLGAAGKHDCTLTRDPQILKKRQEELRLTAEKLLNVFQTGDTQAFFDLVHEKYFGVGEGGTYTLAELKESFRTKDTMYCYLFDSSCISVRPLAETARYASFSELAKRPGARVKYVEVWAMEGLKQPGCSGHINFFWPSKSGEKLVMDTSRFTFTYVRGEWKTVGFDDLVPVSIEPEKVKP